jgi:hypothetical protein
MSDESDKQLDNYYELEDRILSSLKERDGVATAGDVAADTGIPYDRAEIVLRKMLSNYRSHLDVDDDGNLRYRFDPAFSRRGEDRGRVWHNIKKAAWKGFVGFFKVWTMIMMVGYTIVFVLLLLALGIAGLALAMQGDDDSGLEIGFLPIYLVGRFLEFMFWFSLFNRQPSRSYRREPRRRRRRSILSKLRGRGERPSKPFYQKLFQYLFGPDRKTDVLAPEKAFAKFVRKRGGRITAAEWASRTGQSLDDAENALTASIVRFNVDVDVSDDGTLIYRFDELRVTADEEESGGEELDPIWERQVQVAPLTGNPTSTNFWITFFNLFNLAMSAAVLVIFAPALTMAATIGLGWVPLVFSLLFFAVPLARKVSHSQKKRRARRENERREALSIVFKSSEDGEAKPIPEDSIPEKFSTNFLSAYDGEVEVTETGLTVYSFDRLATEFRDAKDARSAARDENVVFGHTVFSSDEEQKSLDEAEMEDFDRRLARELGGDTVFDFDVDEEFVPDLAEEKVNA